MAGLAQGDAGPPADQAGSADDRYPHGSRLGRDAPARPNARMASTVTTSRHRTWANDQLPAWADPAALCEHVDEQLESAAVGMVGWTGVADDETRARTGVVDSRATRIGVAERLGHETDATGVPRLLLAGDEPRACVT